MKEEELIIFFNKAKDYCTEKFPDEVIWQNNVKFEDVTPEKFLREFVYVVIHAGKSNKATRTIANRVFAGGKINPKEMPMNGQKSAVIRGINECVKWFDTVKSLETDREKIEYLQTLPWIGKITKYHLAKNIGIDCVKPDIHLKRLAKRFEFDTPRGMCEFIQTKCDVKLAVIDIVLWRYCNMHPEEMKLMKQVIL